VTLDPGAFVPVAATNVPAPKFVHCVLEP